MDILAVVSDKRLARRVVHALREMRCVVVGDLDAAEGHLRQHAVDVVVAMRELRDGVATDLLDGVATSPTVPLVVLAEDSHERQAVEVMKAGASDYLTLTPKSLAALPHIVVAARREFALQERARTAEDRLRHANRLIGTGRLAAVTAHEVGTPLNVARMHAQLLQQSSTDPQLLRGCTTIIEQIDVVTARLQGMLDYSRVGATRHDPMSLEAAVTEAVDLLHPLLVRHGVTLDIRARDLVVVANRPQIRQVLFNLLMNSIHALRDDGGHIQVVLGEESHAEGRFATVAVIDDGPGVPEEMQPHLFEAFFTTKSAGTGLGLAVCREIAVSHDGWLHFIPLPYCTRFVLGLPLAG